MRHGITGRTFVAQRKPLVHAETMLLVDDGQGQVMEDHRLLHQRMRADDNLRGTGGDFGQHLRACLAGDLAGQPCHADAQRLQPVAQVGEVLFGQQFSGCSERGLLAGFHREHGGHGGDYGLAAAHIALYEAQHGRGLFQVFTNLFEHALLRAGQRERQHRYQLGNQRSLARKLWRTMLLQGDALSPQAEVVRQQFFQCQATLRGMRASRQRSKVCIARRPMHAEHGLSQRGQLQSTQQVGRQQLQRCVIRQPIQRLCNELAHRGRTNALHRGVDRVQCIAE